METQKTKQMDINDYARELERSNTVTHWLSEIANILKCQQNINTADLRELLIIAHRVPGDADRRKLADIAEKWLRKLPIETN
jgi:hypothetical protein